MASRGTVGGYRLAGLLLAVGCVVFGAGVVLYALLPNDLGLPAAGSSYPNALKEAASRGPSMMRAGRLMLLAGIALAALGIQTARGSDGHGPAAVPVGSAREADDNP